MSSAASRIPNFAGVALVDILANGVAVLIIVIVLSIAARSEKEERYSEKVQEVSAVMTREFSTSLVLNRLAASPPAELHDYETSEIDRIWDPAIMPVLEFHRSMVRDPYSGAVWSRNELLETPNGLDTYLMTLGDYARTHVRGDIYDVGTYYLVMSILRDHDIRIWHWHFIGGTGGTESSGSPADCPPGVSFEDCTALGGGGNLNEQVPGVLDLQGLEGFASQGNGSDSDDSGGAWPPSDMGSQDGENRGQGEQIPDSAQIPEGSSLGRIEPQGRAPGALDSFPDAQSYSQAPNNSQSRGPGGNSNGEPSTNQPNSTGMTLRLADPNTNQLDLDGIAMETPDPQQLLQALMMYIKDVQTMLDQNFPPTELLESFSDQITQNLEALDRLPVEEQAVVLNVYDNIQLMLRSRGGVRAPEPIVIAIEYREKIDYAYLQVLPNRLLLDAVAVTDQSNTSLDFDSATPKLSINKFPDVWEGLQVPLHRGSVLLMSPINATSTEPSWYAIAHISAALDDIIVGFLYGTIDADGYFSIYADSNRLRLNLAEITPTHRVAFFSVKAWLVSMYVVFGILLLGLLLFWRPGLKKT